MPVVRGVQATALAALALYAAHALVGLGGEGFDAFAQDWLYNGVIAAAALLCLTRAAVGPERLAWLLLGLGVSSWFAGELYYTLVLADAAEPPYPSLSDALSLAFYPASYAALVLLLRRRVASFPLSHCVDGLVAALAAAALAGAALLDPVIASTGGDWAVVATDLSYPVANVMLLALVAGLLAVSGWRPGRSWTLIGAGLVAIAAADGIFLYQAATESYAEGTLLDALWPAAALLLGYAAWVPDSPARSVRLEGWRTLVIPSAFALAAVGLLLAGSIRSLNDAVAILASAALVAAICRMGLTFGENMRMLARSRHQALTDSLTGLGNRRKLLEDLEDHLARASADHPRALVVLDLDGFKRYNDTFGHPAGDALLQRLGHSLDAAARSFGSAYRLGGDEFCALVTDPRRFEAATRAAVDALADRGEGFAVTASRGVVEIPREASTPDRALQIADERLYAQKAVRARSAAAQETRNALIQALAEREPGLREHVDGVAALTRAVASRLALDAATLDLAVRAAELHDIGKVAVPEAILAKTEPLDDFESGFVRHHTLVGERILSAAPALRPVAVVVRAAHEHWDGTGYPDGLSGEEIPMAARIVAVCDAYDALASGLGLSDAAALAEVRGRAGRELDPAVVEALAAVVTAEHGQVAEVPA